jgi:hypothetical protein
MDVGVPEYRKGHSVAIQAWNMFHGWQPVVFDTEEDEEMFTLLPPLHWPITAFETIAEGGTLRVPDAVTRVLNKGCGNRHIRTHFRYLVSVTHTLNQVRSRALEILQTVVVEDPIVVPVSSPPSFLQNVVQGSQIIQAHTTGSTQTVSLETPKLGTSTSWWTPVWQRLTGTAIWWVLGITATTLTTAYVVLH